MSLALIDHSGVDHGINLDRAAAVLNKQLGHVAQTGWPILLDVRHYRRPPATAWPVYLLDNADQADALGYHTTTPDGQPLGKVFVGDALKYGLDPMVTLSHEVLEIAADPWATCAFDIGTDGSGRQWFAAAEICDPVEADADGYLIDGVRVSNFVTPAWFAPGAVGPWDWRRQLKGPLTLRQGGYISVNVAGKWSNITRASDGAASRASFAHRYLARAERPQPFDGVSST